MSGTGLATTTQAACDEFDAGRDDSYPSYRFGRSKNSNTSSVGKYSESNYLRGRFPLLPLPFLTNYALLVEYNRLRTGSMQKSRERVRGRFKTQSTAMAGWCNSV